jgi:hypothetical protein
LRKLNHTLHLVLNNSVSKYELVKIFNKVYGRNIIINESKQTSDKVDRTLKSIYLEESESDMEESIHQLFLYSQKSLIFSKS